MLPDKRIGDVYSGIIFRASRSAASRVDGKPLCATAQKSNAAPVSNADKKVHIQGLGFSAGQEPAKTSELILEFDLVRRSTDDVA